MAATRKDILTARDTELMRLLAFCPLQTTDQVVRLSLPAPDAVSSRGPAKRGYHIPERGFANYDTARRRLYKLQKRGYLTNYQPTVNHPMMWKLTPRGHTTIVHNILWLERRHDIELPYSDYVPDPVRAEHYYAATEIFVGIQPALTRLCGEPPAWDWRDERRAFDSWTVGIRDNKKLRYQPDAEIEVGGYTMILERQTERAAKRYEEIEKKIESHAKYIKSNDELTPEIAETLLVYDLERDARYAEKAAREVGIRVVALTPKEAIAHVIYVAQQMMKASGQYAPASDATPPTPVLASAGSKPKADDEYESLFGEDIPL